MADKDLDKRLAALEKGLAAAEDRAKKAEAANVALERELKQSKSAHRDSVTQLQAQVHGLNAMRDLTGGPESPYSKDSSARYEELKKATVKTKDGRRHYYAEQPCYIADNGRPPYTFYPAESIVSLPADQDPSVTWRPVEVVGKDPKSGKLTFAIKGSMAEVTTEDVDPGQQVDDGEKKPRGPTNKDFNDKRAAEAEKMAQMGAGAPARAADSDVG
jgi:hypothetical protein